ncbi:conserved hypothetical protein [Frankia canadensis]|uniref:Uncharacterized protein n=1 Tax=Frankia canadensis TaxID=1836972 RepID=A0A2I2KXS6_9ACTN|nr:conserved hypothetical protein [Frankia canadensis]SOU57751.1 conserved hypothetical protein [Frankia canadensis]
MPGTPRTARSPGGQVVVAVHVVVVPGRKRQAHRPYRHIVSTGRDTTHRRCRSTSAGHAREAAMGVRCHYPTDRYAADQVVWLVPAALRLAAHRRPVTRGAITPAGSRRVPSCPTSPIDDQCWSPPASRRWAR